MTKTWSSPATHDAGTCLVWPRGQSQAEAYASANASEEQETKKSESGVSEGGREGREWRAGVERGGERESRVR